MEKINKRDFIAALYTPHILISVKTAKEINHDRLSEFLTAVDKATASGYDIRTVAARKSNHLEFSDGSRLYFDSFATREYFRKGSAVCVCITECGAEMSKIITYKLVLN